jgi:hypothetical protein
MKSAPYFSTSRRTRPTTKLPAGRPHPPNPIELPCGAPASSPNSPAGLSSPNFPARHHPLRRTSLRPLHRTSLWDTTFFTERPCGATLSLPNFPAGTTLFAELPCAPLHRTSLWGTTYFTELHCGPFRAFRKVRFGGAIRAQHLFLGRVQLWSTTCGIKCGDVARVHSVANVPPTSARLFSCPCVAHAGGADSGHGKKNTHHCVFHN